MPDKICNKFRISGAYRKNIITKGWIILTINSLKYTFEKVNICEHTYF